MAPTRMYACPHCNSTKMFMAFKDGSLLKVLEDPQDVEGLENVKELLCTECNLWFPNPTLGAGAHKRVLEGELVMVTGLNSPNTIKLVATGVRLPFHYDTYPEEILGVLRKQPKRLVADILEFSEHAESSLCIRASEEGNPNLWLYRLDKKRLRKALKR